MRGCTNVSKQMGHSVRWRSASPGSSLAAVTDGDVTAAVVAGTAAAEAAGMGGGRVVIVELVDALFDAGWSVTNWSKSLAAAAPASSASRSAVKV